MRRIAAIILATIAVLSCSKKPSEPVPEFVGNDNLVLKIKGNNKIEYVPTSFQIGFSRDKKQFRVHNDTMSEYYILTCSELPQNEGQTITCSLKYAANTNISYKDGLEFKVIKRSDNGRYWLWCRRKDISISVQEIPQPSGY